MQQANQQLEAILTPEQKAKFEAARAQDRNGAGASSGAPASAGPPPPASASSAAPSGRHGRQAQSGAPPSAQPAAANAAPPAGQGRGGGPGRLIAALDLDAGQQAKVKAIFDAARAKAGDDPDARRAAMRAAMSQVDAILRPDQKAKLAQLRAQMQARGGPGGAQ